MDAVGACVAAKQCLAYQVAITMTADIVCFGSAATDLYIEPCMRFGETATRQDVDLLFVPRSSNDDDDAGPVEAFVRSVVARLDMTFPALAGGLSWYTNIVSTGLHCVHLSMKGRHFADVTQLPSALNALVEARFPRQRSLLLLPPPMPQSTTDLFVSVASLPELLHRLACISESMPLLDGLDIVKPHYNTAVIQKSRLRLRRLRELTLLGMLREVPCDWGSDLRVLTEPRCLVQTEPCCMPDFAVPAAATYKQQLSAQSSAHEEELAAVAIAHKRQLFALTRTHEKEVSRLTGTHNRRVAALTDANKKHLSSLQSAMSDMTASFAQLASDKLAALDRKLTAANASGRRVAEFITTTYQRVTTAAKNAVEASAKALMDIRVEVYASSHSASSPLLRRLHARTQNILEETERHRGADIPCLQHYMGAYAYTTKKMACLKAYPHTLLPADRGGGGDDGKRHIMGSFSLFYRMLQLSKEGGTDPERDDVRVHAPYSTWGSQTATIVTQNLTRYAHCVAAADPTITSCVPFVDADDDSIKVLVVHRDQNGAPPVPCPTPVPTPPVQFMLHMLHNVVDAITSPILKDVRKLRDALTNVEKMALEVAAELDIAAEERTAHPPYLAHLESLQLMEKDLVLYTVAFSLEQRRVFVWKEAGASVGRSKKKKTKKRAKQATSVQ
jgi:hypothetical protein